MALGGQGIIIVRRRLRIITGAGVTALLAWALHGPLGQGEAFIAGLRLRSITALAAHGLGDVRISYPAAPFARIARLSGAAGPDRQAEALAIVGGVAGNGGAVWHETARNAAGADGVGAPSPAAVRMLAGAPEKSLAATPEMGDAKSSGASAGSAALSMAATAGAFARAGHEAGGTMAPLPAAACQQSVDDALAGRTVQFRDGSAWLSPDSRRIIAHVAAALRGCRGQVLAVGGHGNGDSVANRAMADERARRVRAALIEAGVPAEAVRARGYGATRPLHAGRPVDPANQRVSFTIMAGED